MLVWEGGSAMTSEIVSLPVAFRSDDATIEGYLSIPVAKTPCSGILVLPERYGLVEYIKDVTRRLARKGYVALAWEPRSRKGFNEILSDNHDMVSVKECSDAVQYLNTSGLVKGGQIGVVGFCWGGHIAGILACLEPAVKATVIYYGGSGRAERSVKHPFSVTEIADGLRSPLLGLYAEVDTHPTLEDVKRFEEALKRHKKDFEFKIYQGAKHGFHNDEMPERYNQKAAEDAWEKTLAFFGKFLQA
jgi:carboxymethylenebutenolidase